MKTFRLALACSFTALTVIACSKAGQNKTAETLPVVVAPAPAPVLAPPPAPASTDNADRMKAYTFEQRDAFKSLVTELTAQTAATGAEMNLGYNSMLASPERRAAMEALARSAADFSAQAHALDNVSAETWDSIKSALVTSWQNHAGALAKAREIKN